MSTATPNAQSARAWRAPRLRAATALLLLFCPSAVFAADAAPLPPPPELMADFGYDPEFEEETAPTNPDEVRRALEPPSTVAAPAVHSVPAPQPNPYQPYQAAVTTGPAPVRVTSVNRDFTFSPPASNLPADYYNLPLDGMVTESIPGVMLPIPDDSFVDPGFRPAAPVRQAGPGLSIRQLEPFFALAKGSESVALDARAKGDERTYNDQIGKAIDAYAEIVAMADAIDSEAREEAWYGMARCEYRRGNWWAAFEALERSFPKQFEKDEVSGRIKLQMFIGERLWRMGGEKVPGSEVDGVALTGHQAAAKVYEKAFFNLPTAQEAPLALLRQGDVAAMNEDWDGAVKFYRQVIEFYPDTDQAMQARSSLATSVLRKEWEGGLPEKGRQDLESLMDDVERQSGRLSPEAEERRREAVGLGSTLEADRDLRQAKAYLKQLRVKKSRDAAVFLLGNVVSLYPNTPQSEEAAEILRGMGIEPPMVLSDGNRFPLSRGWAEGTRPGTDTGGFSGGSVAIEGQDDMSDGASSSFIAPSATRETVYEAPPSVQIEMPGINPQP